MELILIYYICPVNVFAFAMFGYDKWCAMNGKYRIPESVLLSLAVIGGSVGAWCGMKVWHHKTLHRKFRYGLPLMILLQIIGILYLFLMNSGIWLGLN